jgi:hypothetical protein
MNLRLIEYPPTAWTASGALKGAMELRPEGRSDHDVSVGGTRRREQLAADELSDHTFGQLEQILVRRLRSNDRYALH